MAVKPVFPYCSGALGCLAAAVASTSPSTFRVIISGAAEMPSLLRGLEVVRKKLGTGNKEGMKRSMTGGFSRRGLCLARWLGPALTAQRCSHCINDPSACMSSTASPVGLGQVCLFPVSQNPRTGPTAGIPAVGPPDPLCPDHPVFRVCTDGFGGHAGCQSNMTEAQGMKW